MVNKHRSRGLLAASFFRAVQWNIAGSVATILVQLATTAILARLLTPADFGCFAVANVAFIIATHLNDRGLISSIIREPVFHCEVIGSIILLSLFLSLGLASLAFLLAPLAGIGLPLGVGMVVEGLVRMMSLSILISGLGAPAQAIMQRELRFRELGFCQFAGIALGTGATAIAFALTNHGSWSLAYGTVANVAIVTVGCWWKLRDRWSISWRSHHVMRVGVVGLQMALLRVLDVLWSQLPLVIAHAHLSSFDVGLYQRSQTLVEVGINSTTGRVTAVLFPLMASKQDRREFICELIPPLIGLYSLFFFCSAAFVIVTASDIVAVMLGPQWEGAAGPLIIIMFAFASLLVSQPAGCQLEASAVFKPRMISAGYGIISLVLCSLLLVGNFALIGIASAAVISGAGAGIICIVGVVRHFRIEVRSIASWMISSLAVAGILGAIMAICNWFISKEVWSPELRLVIMTIIAAAVVIIEFRLLLSKVKRQVLSNYLPPGISGPTNVIAKIFGLKGAKSA